MYDKYTNLDSNYLINFKYNDNKDSVWYSCTSKFKKLNTFSCLAEVQNLSQQEKRILLDPRNFRFTLNQFCSIQYLLENSLSNNSGLLAMTSGGRTVNERPQECLINYGADIDIASAYGSELIKIKYPLGRPRIICTAANTQKVLTLGQFMDRFGEKFKKNNLYKIVVSGLLSFSQDLIFSKIPNNQSLKYKVEQIYNLEPDEQAVKADFVLLRREIINGTITHDTWTILKKVCTKQELSEIRNLKIQAALYFFDDDEVSSPEELADCILKDKGKYTYDHKLQVTIDKRTFKYYPIKVSDFISPLVLKRLILKKSKDPFASLKPQRGL